ncbi:asparagine synthase-related protein [Haloarcula sp. JP-L23]|uniref:asparagine synthase-related protein n=1 Tax=Haloarcula sp. JP-L23 TaxID=2716717 RepID=UPI00140EB300|nr:asparagine synthase [Haloarcula sp. JP-L23]
MVGIVVAGVPTATAESLVESLHQEPWYEVETVTAGDTELGLVHHGAKDPEGHTVLRADGRAGVVHGVVSNRAALGYGTDQALLSALLERPREVLPELNGPFLLACVDVDGRVLVASDLLCSRPCFYAETDDGLVVASQVGAVADHLDTLSVDPRAVGDMLSFGGVLGEKTLLEEVSALRPATLLTDDGTVTTERYWRPDYGTKPVEGYVEETIERYREAVGNVADTLVGDVSLWLSGGLDSRTLAAALAEQDIEFDTLTYDSNPRDGSNVKIARQVADHLDADTERVVFEPGDFAKQVKRGIRVTSGLKPWTVYLHPDYIMDRLHDRTDIVMEAAPQGELFGEQPWLYHLTGVDSAFEGIRRLGGSVERDTIRNLVAGDADPHDTIETELTESEGDSQTETVMDVWYRNFCSNTHFRSSELYRSQVGMRLPWIDRSLLDHLAKMPHRQFRIGYVPGTNGRIPRSMAPLKQDVINEMDPGQAGIPYERTRLPLTRPMWQHDATFVAKRVGWKLLGDGRPEGHFGVWYRENDEVRQIIDGWIDDACDRDLFDETTLRRLQREHKQGQASHLHALSVVTTVECWLQEYADTVGIADIADAEAATPRATD